MKAYKTTDDTITGGISIDDTVVRLDEAELKESDGRIVINTDSEPDYSYTWSPITIDPSSTTTTLGGVYWTNAGGNGEVEELRNRVNKLEKEVQDLKDLVRMLTNE